MDNIRNYLTPRGTPPWNFKNHSQPYLTPLTFKSTLTTLGSISGGRGSFEKKFENKEKNGESEIREHTTLARVVGVDITSSLGMKTTTELCRQKRRRIQASSHNRGILQLQAAGIGGAGIDI